MAKAKPSAVIVAAILVAVGSLLPWARSGIFSLAGTDGDGIFTLAAGVVVAVIAAVRGYSNTTRVAGFLGGALGVFITGSIFTDFEFATQFTGGGLILTLIASLVLAGVSLAAGPREVPAVQGSSQAPRESESTLDSRLDDLERLAGLRERGVLTDDEFEAQKRRLLESKEPTKPKTQPKMESVGPTLYDTKRHSHVGRNVLVGIIALVVLGLAVEDCGNAGGETARPVASRSATTTGSSLTVSQRNAIRDAESYLNFTAFSRSGLIDQLEYEQYSTADATFAVDSLNVDWFEQAAKSAKSYLDFTAFSRGGLIDQLKYEGFTQQQAEYGATAAGL